MRLDLSASDEAAIDVYRSLPGRLAFSWPFEKINVIIEAILARFQV